MRNKTKFNGLLMGATTMAAILLMPASGLAGTKEAQAYFAEAQERQAAGDVSKAELLYAQARQESPNDMAISMGLAELYIAQRRFDSAAALINEATSQHPSDYRVWKALGVYEQAQGNQSKAIAAYEKAYAAGGKEDSHILLNLQQHYESTGNTVRRRQMETQLQVFKPNKNR